MYSVILYNWVKLWCVEWVGCQQDQLKAFEQEKLLLLGKSKNAEEEIERLSQNYAKLLGHQNQKQKIHHILKLKDENQSMKQVELCDDVLLNTLTVKHW